MFLIGFASDTAFKLGHGDFSRITRLCHFMDDLISRMSKAKRRQERRGLQRSLHLENGESDG